MRRDGIDDIYPATPLQEGMLFHAELEPDAGIYWNQLVGTLEGTIDPDRFRRAWEVVVARHDALRTAFVPNKSGRTLQIVRTSIELPFRLEDSRVLSPDERRQRLDEILARDRQERIDPKRAPLWRLWLILTGADTAEIVWSQHHAITDGWSGPIVLDEVFRAYDAICRGAAPSLAPVARLRDFVRWNAAQDDATAREYWSRALEGVTAPTSIGARWARRDAARRNSDRATRSQGMERRVLGEELFARIRDFARTIRVTLGAVLRAAWARTLSVWSGDDEVIFGLTLTARSPDLAGSDRIVGPLINTLPVRMRAGASEVIRSTIESAHEVYVDLESYVRSSLSDVQRRSDVPPGVPLFESILVIENFPFEGEYVAPSRELRLRGVRGIEIDNYPLTLTLLPTSSLEIKISHDTRRLDADDARSILSTFDRILAGLCDRPDCDRPDRAWGDLPILSDHDRERVLVEWNATDVEWPHAASVFDEVRLAAERDPDAAAVSDVNGTWTRRELLDASSRIARELMKNGVRAGDRVGIAVERSRDLVAALLGVWQAGAAYVPLDPDYPHERLEFMTADANLSLILACDASAARVAPLGAPILVHRVDALVPADASEPDSASESPWPGPVSADDVAYVIYTSGSTGRPKGVMIPHVAALNFLRSMERCPGLEPADTLLAVTSLSFDISLLELVGPLLAEGRVRIASREEASDGFRLASIIEDESITVLQGTPSTWRLLLAAGWRPRSGFRAFCGGEPLARDLAEDLLRHVGELWNLYGPTETTVWSTVDRVTSPQDITIGRPIANTRVYVLDANERPVPIGVAGELWIGGAGVMSGYNGRLDLTEAVVRADPFARRPGGRMYRTGDIAAWRVDGRLECFGRRDGQVKLRGFRIESEEIEGVLASHAAVREVVVIVREDVPGDQRLVAYVRPHEGGSDLPREELRALVRSRLPEHMVPSHFIAIDEIPLTPNGKIDRRSLPSPEGAANGVPRPSEPPVSALERSVARLFGEVLGVAEVGRDDNFFDLGGHSILVTRLIHRLEDELRIELPLRALFEGPTVRELADRCARSGEEGVVTRRVAARRRRSIMAVQSRGTRRPLYLVAGAHADENVFLRYLSNLIPHLGLDQPVYGFRARGLDGEDLPHDSVETMAADYIDELLEVDDSGCYFLAGECVGGVVAFEMAQQIAERGARIPTIILLDSLRPRPLSAIELAEYRKARLGRRWTRFKERFDGLSLKEKLVEGTQWARRKVEASLFPTDQVRREQRIRSIETHYPWIIHRYRAAPYAGRVDLIVNAEDHAKCPSLGWEEVVTGELHIHSVPGDHLRRLTEFPRETATAIRASLDSAR
jgi:amino acid adenylation domain-containing protein